MSPLRVILGAYLLVGIFLGMVGIFSAGLHHPMLRATVTFGTLTTGGISAFYVVSRELRRGLKPDAYGRRSVPLSFWLYVSLGFICGTLSCVLGVYFLINHSQLFDAPR
jgi:uncharacterized membrane protein YfcA